MRRTKADTCGVLEQPRPAGDFGGGQAFPERRTLHRRRHVDPGPGSPASLLAGVEPWASQKSFRRKDGSDDGDGANFRGQKRSNETHRSTPDPESRLSKKSFGKESKPAYLGHALVENRNGLIAAAMATQADG